MHFLYYAILYFLEFVCVHTCICTSSILHTFVCKCTCTCCGTRGWRRVLPPTLPTLLIELSDLSAPELAHLARVASQLALWPDCFYCSVTECDHFYTHAGNQTKSPCLSKHFPHHPSSPHPIFHYTPLSGSWEKDHTFCIMRITRTMPHLVMGGICFRFNDLTMFSEVCFS